MSISKHISGRNKSPLPRRAAIPAIAVAALAWAALGAKAQGPAKKMSYDNFKMVQSRNIFDPYRSRDLVLNPPGTRKKEIETRSTPPPVPGVTRPPDYVELTGVLVTEGEAYAFFQGSLPEYNNKVLAVNSSIAGATINKITSAGIEVSRDGKKAAVMVGQTVPLDGSAPGLPPNTGTTTMSAPPAAKPAVDPAAASAQVPLPDVTTGTSNSSAPPPADNLSDAMKRMIERRQKELNQ